MSQNTVSLSQEIKKELRFLNLKRVSLVFGALGVGFGTALMISLAVVGLSVQGLLIMMFPTYGMALFVSGIAIGALISGAVAMGCVRFSKQKVRPYVNIPNEVESLKDIMINFGSYLATIDEKLPKRLGTILFFIHREIKAIKEKSESDKLELKAEIKKIADKSERDTEMFIRELKIKNLAIHKITNLKNVAERRVEEFKKKDSVKIQEIGNNINANDINENTKIDNENTKFKSRD